MQRHALLIGINRYPKVINADLRGCVNDVELMRSVLVGRFGFADERVRTLIDEEATRAGIRAAFDELATAIEVNDIVAFFYAGHGSRKRDPRDSSRIVDSLVPHDSGRGDQPNRDIVDEEIDRWVQRLNEKTPFVTLIIDCCHSGDITRDVFGEAVRELPADLRSVDESLGGGALPPSAARRSSDDEPGHAGWVLGRRRAVVVAACRADELANEHAYFNGERMVRDGAMTFYLSRALHDPGTSGTGTTWRDVFERLAPRITTEYPRQHPQIEGKMDELLFGTEESRPAPYLEVAKVDAGDVELAGGAVHGVVPGSLFSLRPHGIHHRGAGREVARLEVVEVRPATSRTRILEAAGEPAPGQRAFLLRHELPAPALRVAVHAPAARLEALGEMIAAGDFLEPVDDVERADVLVRGVESGWTAVGRDGRLVARERPNDRAALAELVQDLTLVSRYRGLLALDNPDPASRLRQDVRLRVRRFDAASGTLVDAAPAAGSGMVIFEPGEPADFVVENVGEEAFYFTLLQFGVDFAVDLFMPHPDHSIYKKESLKLAPRESASVREYFWRDERYHRIVEKGLPLRLPASFPWAAEPGEETPLGILNLKLLLTREPTHFEFLAQRATRPARLFTHPLARLALLYSTGQGMRNFIPDPVEEAPEKDWATLTMAVGIRASG